MRSPGEKLPKEAKKSSMEEWESRLCIRKEKDKKSAVDRLIEKSEQLKVKDNSETKTKSYNKSVKAKCTTNNFPRSKSVLERQQNVSEVEIGQNSATSQPWFHEKRKESKPFHLYRHKSLDLELLTTQKFAFASGIINENFEVKYDNVKEHKNQSKPRKKSKSENHSLDEKCSEEYLYVRTLPKKIPERKKGIFRKIDSKI